MRSVAIVILSILLFAILAAATQPARAQGLYDLLCVPVFGEDEDGVELEIYCSVVDRDGRPVEQTMVTLTGAGTLNLLDEPGGSTLQAPVEEPATPAYVFLLIDNSGSMENAMPKVKEAVIKAVKELKPGTMIAVSTFNRVDLEDPFEPLVAFTDNHEQVIKVIETIEAVTVKPDNITCLYNAAYRALSYIQGAGLSSHERRALLLFTDGADDDGTGQWCSPPNGPELVKAAARGQVITPIHTIALCPDKSCGNLDQRENIPIVKDLAETSHGSFRQGTPDAMSDAFAAVSGLLRNQRVLRAKIYPSVRDVAVTVRIPLEHDGGVLSDTVSFRVSRSWDAPLPVSFVAHYDSHENTYVLQLRGISHRRIGTIAVELLERDGQGMNKVRDGAPQQVLPPAEGAAPAPLNYKLEARGATPATSLTPGLTPCFNVRGWAPGPNGQPVARVGARPEDDPYVLAEGCTTTYAPLIELSIGTPTVSADRSRLELSVVTPQSLTPRHTVSVIFQAGEQSLPAYPPFTPPAWDKIDVPLPGEILRADRGTYTVTVALYDDGRLVQQVASPFTLEPRAGVDLTIPLVVGAALFILMAVSGVLMFGRRRRIKSDLMNEPLWEELGPAPSPRVLAVITVIQSPGGEPPASVTVTSLPFTIGRRNCDLDLGGDPGISREHLQLITEKDGVALLDPGSFNGTRVEGRRLEPNQSLRIRGVVRVSIGTGTIIEVKA